MSHLGMKILYGQFNSLPYMWCERVFAPWVDMEGIMREKEIPLYGLESGDPIKDFDFIGFTLQYELSFTNVLNMLDLAGVPLRSEDRGELWPLVVAGGPCACNPEPIADFIDLFFIGEGEEVDLEVIDLYREYKKKHATKQEFLRAAAQIEGAVSYTHLFSGNVVVDTIEGAKQVIAMGPVAALEIIKHIGTNGGGFIGANSSTPIENPTIISNLIELYSMMILPGACVITFGKMVRDRKRDLAKAEGEIVERKPKTRKSLTVWTVSYTHLDVYKRQFDNKCGYDSVGIYYFENPKYWIV